MSRTCTCVYFIEKGMPRLASFPVFIFDLCSVYPLLFTECKPKNKNERPETQGLASIIKSYPLRMMHFNQSLHLYISL